MLLLLMCITSARSAPVKMDTVRCVYSEIRGIADSRIWTPLISRPIKLILAPFKIGVSVSALLIVQQKTLQGHF